MTTLIDFIALPIIVVLGLIFMKLVDIHHTLINMKLQEKEYWQTWKEAKEKEKNG